MKTYRKDIEGIQDLKSGNFVICKDNQFFAESGKSFSLWKFDENTGLEYRVATFNKKNIGFVNCK